MLHRRFIVCGAIFCSIGKFYVLSIEQKALLAGCARIGMEDVLRTQFGAAK